MGKQNNFYCHTCNVHLIYDQDYLNCLECDKKYPIIENIPVFIKELNTCQKKNKQYTDELFNEDLKQDNTEISEECFEKLSPQYFRQFGKDSRFKRVLDLGCGDGFLTFNLLQYENSIEEIYGLDISLNTLLSFRKNIRENKIDKKIILLCSTAEKIFLPGNYFDAVVCYRFIHHLPLQPLLKEVYRLLKPGGYFICFKEPHMNYLLTYFKRGYYTLINLISFMLNRVAKNQEYNGQILFKVNTKKFLYSRSYIEKLLRKEGFGRGVFQFSKFLFPFMKVSLYPFYLKFPSLRPYISSILRLTYKIDSRLFKNIIPKEFLQKVSFYSRKL